MIGSIANNRFLQRVNPEITRALADSGSSLEHSEIQQLMRQMVDLGIADNLKLWVHSGLVKTRTSGSDTFVPKAYDISGEENDAAQATNDNQPKLVSDGVHFPDRDMLLPSSYDNGSELSSPFTCMVWMKSTKVDTNQAYIVRSWTTTTDDRCWAIMFQHGELMLYHSNNGLADGANQNNYLGEICDGDWHNIAVVYNNSHWYPYIDGVALDDIDIGNLHNPGTNAPLQMGAFRFEGYLNDTRFINTPISAAQITAIFNQSKGFYGIT